MQAPLVCARRGVCRAKICYGGAQAPPPFDLQLQQPSIDRSARDHVMIDVYYWSTPHGHKLTIFLEEAAYPYNFKPVTIGKGEHSKAESLGVSSNTRIPGVVEQTTPGGGKPIA